MLEQQDDTPTDDHSDHDLVPDTFQKKPESRPEQPLARSAKHDEHDFGQMAKRKSVPEKSIPDWGKPPKKLTFEKPKKTDWSVLDLGKNSRFEVHGSRQSKIFHEKQDLRQSFGTMLNARQREIMSRETADLISKRHGTLGRAAMRKKVKDWEKRGVLDSTESKIFKKRTKLNKSSGSF